MTCVDFIILKVNGVDISSFPHEDAVRSFLTAEEPIIVEVKRRILGRDVTATSQPNRNNLNAAEYDDVESYTPSVVSTAVQTDLSIFTCIPYSQSPYHVDIEEVTLEKCSSEERIGLTVYYSSGSASDDGEDGVEVFIKEIIPKSVAHKDGRLKQGDKILQVNGKDVTNKEQTESLFAESNKTVTLLVSRCIYQNRDFMKNIAHDKNVQLPRNISNNSVDLLESEQLPRHQITNKKTSHPKSSKENSSRVAPEKSPNKKLTEKDLLCNTNSYIQSQMDSINSEISLLNHRMRNIQLTKTSDCKKKSPQLPYIPAPPLSDNEHIYETIPESESEQEPEYFSPYENTVVNQRVLPQQKGIKLTKHSTNSDYKNIYTTSELSNCNKPLAFELTCNLDPNQKDICRSTLTLCHPSDNNMFVHEDTDKNKIQCELCEIYQKNFESIPLNENFKVNSPTNHKSFTKCQFYNSQFTSHIPANTMYTNVANLKQTMLLQQQMFRKELCKESTSRDNNADNIKYVPKSPVEANARKMSSYRLSDCQQVSKKQNAPKAINTTRMEWKVKRRKDGTRYIARRPVRHRIIKNRSSTKSDDSSDVQVYSIADAKNNVHFPKEERKVPSEKLREKNLKHKVIRSSQDNGGVQEHVGTMKTRNNRKAFKDGTEAFPKCPDLPMHPPKISPSTSDKLIGLFSVTTV